MSTGQALVLEVLSGPLDGAILTLQAGAEWSRAGDGPPIFPWDEELGAPQARFVVDEQGWKLEGVKSPHGTYCINREKRIEEDTIPLVAGDLLKASRTWLLVREA